MNLLFNLSGEHNDLPKAEIYATLEGEGIDYKPLLENVKKRLLILWAKTDDPLFINRLAMTKKVGEFIGASESVEEIARSLSLKMCEGTFAVDGECQSLKEGLGEEIWKLGYGVDLLNPNSRILCFEDDKGKYDIAIETPIERDFNDRKPHKRPYFHPTSLNPKMARVLVNLARVKRGDTILDPFCGTGGILIEAGLIGMRVLGCDISDDMVEGCTRNLIHYGVVNGRIRACDALKLADFSEKVDAIVTDLPYGRSSYMTDRDKERFYGGFMASAAAALASGKHLVVVLPASATLPPAPEFELRETHAVYVHKSLTRNIFVLRRK